jgi:hypothetical protein
MKFSEVELPSNKKFGIFFTLLFLTGAGYFYFTSTMSVAYICTVTAAIFFLVTLVKADLLLPLNKLWMRFGFLLGIIVSPIVLGVIFFGLFTPIAFLMRLRGRDELSLKFKCKNTHWVPRNEVIAVNSFKNQF